MSRTLPVNCVYCPSCGEPNPTDYCECSSWDYESQLDLDDDTNTYEITSIDRELNAEIKREYTHR